MAISNHVSGFSAKINGFHFNDNALTGTYPVITIPVLGTIYSGDASQGVCDGLAFAALDLFLHNPCLAPPPDTTGPAANTPLFNYLTKRETDAFLAGNLSNFWKAFQWIHTSDHDTGIFPLVTRGLAWRTVTDEWPAIKADIDAGKPSPVWAVTTPACPITNLPQTAKALANHHQVLVYGYTLDDAKNLTLNIYEPQDHDNDSHTIAFNIANPAHTTIFVAPSISWATVRGLFRSHYEYCDPSAIADGPIGATVSGMVTDATTGKAVPGATVTARGAAPAAVTTDPAGRYAFGKLPVGPYDVSVTAMGYAAQRTGISITAGTNVTANFTLAPDPTTGPGIIEGTVSEEDTTGKERPSSGASVSVGTVASTTTNAKGYYKVSNVPAGACRITATKTGYPSKTVTTTVVAQKTVTVDILLVKTDSH